MPAKTLDEYLKQTTHTITQHQPVKSKYEITGFYKETRFKDTPIGKIPKEWQLVRLDEVTLMIKTGPFGSQLKKTELTNKGIKVYTQENVLHRNFSIGNLYISIEKFKQLRSFEIKPGDVLLTIRGTVGRAVVVPEHIERGIIHTNLAILRVNKEKLLAQFLEKIINDSNIFINQIKSGSSSTTLPALYAKSIKMLRLPIPPLEEQWGIAEVLSALDRAIEATERLIGRLERLKRGLIQELLTRGIGHREYKQTPIGKIPKEWRIVKLSEVSKIDTKPVMPRPGIKYYYLGLEDIESETGRILKPGNMLTDGSEIKSTKYVFTPRHILYGRLRPYLNKVALPDRDGICSTDLLPVLPKENLVLREYLAYVLRSKRFVKYASDRMKGTNHPRISQKDILMYVFPLPPIDEQKVIVKVLNSIDEWIELEKRRKEKLEPLKRGLTELLLTGRVRVRVERLDGAENSSGSDGGG